MSEREQKQVYLTNRKKGKLMIAAGFVLVAVAILSAIGGGPKSDALQALAGIGFFA